MHVSFLPLTVCFGFFCLTSQLFNWFCGEFHWTEVIVLLWKDSNAKNIMNISIKISGIRNFQHLKNTTSYWNKCTLSHIGSKQTAVLTDAGDEVIKPVLGKQRILQTPEVELQHASHRVDVVVALLINQRVITWTRETNESNTSLHTFRSSSSRRLTSLEGVLDIVDLHLWPWHPKYALMLETCQEHNQFGVQVVLIRCDNTVDRQLTKMDTNKTDFVEE